MLKDAHILLDSCVINNLLSKESELVSGTRDVLRELHSLGSSFYISHLTKYELLRSIPENRRSKCEEMLDKLVKIETDDSRLGRAIRLYSLYKDHPEVKNHLASISDVDIFIGSLIFNDKNTYLLTADYCDFPRPFFLEANVWGVEYRRSTRKKSFIYYYLLKANLSEF